MEPLTGRFPVGELVWRPLGESLKPAGGVVVASERDKGLGPQEPFGSQGVKRRDRPVMPPALGSNLLERRECVLGSALEKCDERPHPARPVARRGRGAVRRGEVFAFIGVL